MNTVLFSFTLQGRQERSKQQRKAGALDAYAVNYTSLENKLN